MDDGTATTAASGDEFRETDLMRKLAEALVAEGLSFTPWQIANFYTALQTKGFVILTGISGTGKSKLAQGIARIVAGETVDAERRAEVNEFGEDSPATVATGASSESQEGGTLRRIEIPAPVKASASGRLHIWRPLKNALGAFQTPGVGEEAEVWVTLGEAGANARLTSRSHPRRDQVVELRLPRLVKDWLAGLPHGDHQLTADALIDRGILKELRFLGWEDNPLYFVSNDAIRDQLGDNAASGADSATQPSTEEESVDSPSLDVGHGVENWLFIPVRPDWRDSKSLLGYYNPLTERYEWTPFLRFLLQAVESYGNGDGDGRAWFVILDEMNLAHVEYYFADLLSVLESGRDPKEGWTSEPLRFVYPETAAGDLPPAVVKLPPNLYVVGTVNADETTHAFSPKVLDRAFTLELNTVDFGNYPPTASDNVESPPVADGDLLNAFTNGGRFPRIEKAVIAAHVAGHPEVRTWLTSLNALLVPHGLHFGYRVFEEIVTFLVQAKSNGLFEDIGGYENPHEAAFDAAVLMKVLPKFHGSRGKLEAPLRSVLAWCLDPASSIAPPTAQSSFDGLSAQVPAATIYRMPRTAERAERMLDELRRDGFTSFG